MATYTTNFYSKSSRLFIQSGVEILSAEGTTQGDSIVMPMYSMGIMLLLNKIKKNSASEVKHLSLVRPLWKSLMASVTSRFHENTFCNGGLTLLFPRRKTGKIFSIFLQFLGILGKIYVQYSCLYFLDR